MELKRSEYMAAVAIIRELRDMGFSEEQAGEAVAEMREANPGLLGDDPQAFKRKAMEHALAVGKRKPPAKG